MRRKDEPDQEYALHLLLNQYLQHYLAGIQFEIPWFQQRVPPTPREAALPRLAQCGIALPLVQYPACYQSERLLIQG